MNYDKGLSQSYFDPRTCGSDNDNRSNHSSKDGSSLLDSILNERMKLECQNFSKHYHSDQIDEIQLERGFEVKGSIKSEKSVLSVSNYGEDSIVSKKRQLFKCSQCPKVFSNSSAIAKHKLTHSDERKYVCEVCNKAFKRQDHLNGHKHTHKANKPHACHLCDRSYSDARSLRRHYENQHQNEFLRSQEQKLGRESRGSSVDDNGSAIDVFGLLDETKCIKCDVCSKAFKNQSALNGHMRLHGGYGPTKNTISGPGEQRLAPLLTACSPEPSDIQVASIARPNNTVSSSDGTQSQLPSQESIGHCNLVQKFGQSLSAISTTAINEVNPSNVNIDDLCMCLSPMAGHSDLHPGTCVTVPHETISSCHDSNISDHYQSHYSPITPALPRTTITDSTHIFNYQPQYRSTNDDHQYQQYHWNESYTYNEPITTTDRGTHSLPHIPSTSSNNFQDLIMNLESIDPGNGLDPEWCKYINYDTNIAADSSESDSILKKENIDSTTNVDIKYKCCDLGNADENTQSSLYLQSSLADMTMPIPPKKNKNRPAPIFIPPQTSAHMSRLRSPRVWNATDGREVKIPPYTPPPMLSPQRKGSGLFNCLWHVNSRTSGNVPMTSHQWGAQLGSNAITTMSNSYGSDHLVSSSSIGTHQISSVLAFSPTKNRVTPVWFDNNSESLSIAPRNGEPEHFIYQDECLECQPQSQEDKDGLPTSATPRINIGAKYQAQLPFCHYNSRCPEEYKRDCDVLLWDPSQFKDTVENSSSLDLLMKIASSPAVKSCGLNMEYTFHLLCKFKGDLEKTLQALLEDSFVVYDYVYAETTNWTTDEIYKFQDRLKKHDRDFMQVALDLQSCGMNKSVKACVEFYYVWKQMNNVKDIGRYRLKTSRKKMVSSCGANDNGINSVTVGDLVTGVQTSECGYNLRNKLTNGNQKLNISYSSYDYKTSSDNSSRETSPTRGKPAKGVSASGNGERVKKPRSYHCSFCKRKFTKATTLGNHLRNHHSANVSRDKLTSR